MKQQAHSSRTLLTRFAKAENGAVAIVFTFVLIPLIAITGLAANYSAANTRRSEYQTIADAAALAGATATTNDTDAQRKTRAQDWFNEQIAIQKLPAPTLDVSVANGAVTVNVSGTVKPMINMDYLGSTDLKVSSTAQIATATIRRVLDVAFCIDATGSMQNTIDSVKAKATSFSDDLNTALTARGLEKFDYTRIRVIFYRDFSYDDGKKHNLGWPYGKVQFALPMLSSNFFVQPDKKDDLEDYLGTENARGGGDLPESGYECIHAGMNSDWFKKGDSIPKSSAKADAVYPVTVLWSDAAAKPIGDPDSIEAKLYPADMPRTVAGFIAEWNNASVIDQTNKMLVHFGLCSDESWSTARSLTGYMCGGSLNDGNTNMVNKIADAMVVRYKNLTTRLTK